MVKWSDYLNAVKGHAAASIQPFTLPHRNRETHTSLAQIMLIWPLGTYFSEILIGIQIFLIKKMHLKMSSAEWRPYFLGLSVLNEASLRAVINSTKLYGFRAFNLPWAWVTKKTPCLYQYQFTKIIKPGIRLTGSRIEIQSHAMLKSLLAHMMSDADFS